MLVDAKERFAQRAVDWMMGDDTLSSEEMIKRMAMWPKDFQKMITQKVKEQHGA